MAAKRTKVPPKVVNAIVTADAENPAAVVSISLRQKFGIAQMPNPLNRCWGFPRWNGC